MKKLELRTSKTYSKRQNLVQNKNIDVQNLENIGPPIGVFHSDFVRYYATFFGFHQRVSPLFVSILCNTMDVKKSRRVPPFTNFRHCDTVQKSYFQIFFGKFLKFSQGSPLIFFHILQLIGASQSPKDPPFTILSLRYSANFCRSRLVQCYLYAAFCSF